MKCDIYLTIIILLQDTALSFQIIQHNEVQQIPEEYVALVPGQSMYVKTTWLNHVQATFRNRSKKVALKNMMSGIYEPKDVQGQTAASLLATPVGRALRGESINDHIKICQMMHQIYMYTELK